MGAEGSLLSLDCSSALSLAWGSALLAGVLSFASPKESSQRKGDPRLRGRRCRLPCATRRWRGLRNSGLRPSDSPRPFSASACVARRVTRGPDGNTEPGSNRCCKKIKISRKPASNRVVFSAPLRGAEQRRKAGGLWLALFEPQASLASHPALRVAQGAGQRPAPTQGSPFLCLLSFGEAKESNAASKAEPQPNSRTQARGPASC